MPETRETKLAIIARYQAEHDKARVEEKKRTAFRLQTAKGYLLNNTEIPTEEEYNALPKGGRIPSEPGSWD